VRSGPFWSKWLGRVQGRASRAKETGRQPERRSESSIDRPGSPAWEAAQQEEVAAEIAVESAARSGGAAPPAGADTRHVDWLTSGAGFDDRTFSSLMNAVADGMLAAAGDFHARRSAG
jgi:hypothetical protein